MTPKEQTRLQVLNSLLAEHMTLEQAATLIGVSERHTRRILAAYREEGAVALAHGHRGRRAPNATPGSIAADAVHLARTKYQGANHTHLSELLSEREGIEIGRTTLRCILVKAGLSSLLMESLVERCGVPVALYTDRHGVFRHTPGSGLPGMLTQFSLAMEELGIQIVFALSPSG